MAEFGSVESFMASDIVFEFTCVNCSNWSSTTRSIKSDQMPEYNNEACCAIIRYKAFSHSISSRFPIPCRVGFHLNRTVELQFTNN